MKILLLVSVMAAMVFVSCETSCYYQTDCPEDSCCTGTFYAGKRCQRHGGYMDQCEQPNRAGDYRVSCPCQEGFICSPIARCQEM